ncbi:YveK family protein [Bacillus sp. FDAARGOS_1420]|uniref:YveK family protein n=1 Tax=unclassified Bacillus (in: firmicutes) TaxID=185979 RepID=UPI001C5AF2CB|nr:Wzz/FepE/Etk N-terminal domain-containing protein [Bacillus sp. FDAARGOS_1420]MBW3496667.1 capsular biosynthesis protein [Bacillus sp. FDAARGOS_1420]
MEETIRLKDLFDILKKHVLIILSIAIGAAIVSSIINFYFVTPIYQSSTQILVNQKKQEGVIQPGEVQTNIQLTNTYKVIIKSPVILEQVKNKLKLGISVQELSKRINVANEKDSQVIIITIQDEDIKTASNIANTIAEVFKDEIAKIMNVDNVTILSKAEINEGEAPVKPRPILNIGIVFGIGLILALGLAFLLEYLDSTLKTEEDIEKELQLPVFGVVTHISEEKRNVNNGLTDTKKVRKRTIGS